MTGEVTVKRFVVSRMDHTWGRPMTRDTAEKRVLDLSQKAGGPFRLRYRSDSRWGPKLMFKELKPKLDARMDHLTHGDVLWVDNSKDPDATIRTAVVISNIDPLDLINCTDPCEVIIYDLRQNFPNHLNLGWYNCRRIAGSSSWSQHAWGNAYDAGGSTTTLKAIAAHCIAKAKSGSLPVAQVIYNRQVWTPGSGLAFYGGSDPHTTHVHITARPEMSGTPPCA